MELAINYAKSNFTRVFRSKYEQKVDYSISKVVRALSMCHTMLYFRAISTTSNTAGRIMYATEHVTFVKDEITPATKAMIIHSIMDGGGPRTSFFILYSPPTSFGSSNPILWEVSISKTTARWQASVSFNKTEGLLVMELTLNQCASLLLLFDFNNNWCSPSRKVLPFSITLDTYF